MFISFKKKFAIENAKLNKIAIIRNFMLRVHKEIIKIRTARV
jgi:hypothetical protein